MDSVRSIGRDAGRLLRVPLAHATARKAALALATQRKIRLLSGGKRRRMAFDLGGRENLTEAQQQLIRRCAMISAQCELMEQETVGGKPLNAIAYGTLTGHLTRTLNALGLKREPIDVTPALHEYLDTLQAPAEPPDLVAVASADEGEN
jgi:hypothetical protein